MNILESITIALDAVRAQKLRSGLTLLSVAIGVFAIVASSGITSTLGNAVSAQMADLGENSFLIQRTPSISFGSNWRKYMKRKPISYPQALEFRRRMTLTPLVTISNTAPNYRIKAGLESTNSNVSLIGVDDLYFSVNVATIAEGRSFTEADITLGAHSAVIGNDVVTSLFPHSDPIGQKITIKNQQFTVVGVLETKGAVLGQSQDNRVLIPISLFVKYYTWEWDISVDISVRALDKLSLGTAMDEATGIMRTLRGVKAWEENTFELDGNDAIASQFGGFTTGIAIVAWICGIGALFAAGIGIMNMMLVSVRERTREIGIRKALGARRAWITRQFLVESITLCQLGGMIGVVLGLMTTVLIVLVLRGTGAEQLELVLPWGSVIFSVIVCTLIGLVFGIYPAYKAAQLDPIEALRYE